jgi:RNA polymerase sigma-70 factor, ECF subfamily
MSNPSDVDIDAAFEKRSRLFLRHQAMLRDYVRFLVRGAPEMEDLLQEIGVQVLKSQTAPLAPEEFPAWSRGVARNVVLHHWRSHRRSKEVVTDRMASLLDQAYVEMDAQADVWHERRLALRMCLEGMDERARDLILRRYHDHETSDTAAQRLGRSAVAVRKTLMKVKRGLLTCVQRRLAMEEAV